VHISIAGRRAGLVDAVIAEWTKLRSVRSTLWSILTAGCVSIGTGILAARSPNIRPAATVHADEVVKVALAGFVFGQLAICVLAVLVATSEYGTGAIRTSLSAVPSRGRLLAAKALALAGTSLIAGTAISILSYLVSRTVLTSRAAHVASLDGASVRAVLGGGLYLAVLSLFALALGMILRRSAGAITTAIFVVLILPSVLPAFGRTGISIYKWWPTEAGQQVMRVNSTTGMLAPWSGFALFCVATAALSCVAYLLFRRRDA
jgi:ABC-2 type transport system permease protein